MLAHAARQRYCFNKTKKRDSWLAAQLISQGKRRTWVVALPLSRCLSSWRCKSRARLKSCWPWTGDLRTTKWPCPSWNAEWSFWSWASTSGASLRSVHEYLNDLGGGRSPTAASSPCLAPSMTRSKCVFFVWKCEPMLLVLAARVAMLTAMEASTVNHGEPRAVYKYWSQAGQVLGVPCSSHECQGGHVE